MSTLFLRDKYNKTIVDIDIWTKCDDEFGNKPYTELSAVVCIEPYSIFLLSNQERAYEIIKEFDCIGELRGWMWEVYFCRKDNDGTNTEDVYTEVKKMLVELGNKYNLAVVED